MSCPTFWAFKCFSMYSEKVHLRLLVYFSQSLFPFQLLLIQCYVKALQILIAFSRSRWSWRAVPRTCSPATWSSWGNPEPGWPPSRILTSFAATGTSRGWWRTFWPSWTESGTGRSGSTTARARARGTGSGGRRASNVNTTANQTLWIQVNI